MLDLVSVDVFDSRSLVSVETPHGRFAIARVEESFYMFADSCTHASCPLSDGFLEGRVLTCECHFSEFDVSSGRVLTEPAESDLLVMEISRRDNMLIIDERQLASLGGT